MELSNKEDLLKILNFYRLRPKKLLGQNFLINPEIFKEIIKSAELNKKDIILEIGAGLGTLTEKLSQQSRLVVAIEKDKNLADILKKITFPYNNIKIINDDVLKIFKDKEEFEKYKLKNYKIVANLPYNITSPVLKKFLTGYYKPSLMVLMVQKEVAEKIVNKPPKMSILSLSVQAYGQPEIVTYIKRSNFWPSPKVESAIIKIKNIGTRINFEEKEFFKLIRIGFSSPRKTLINNLTAGFRKDKEDFKKLFRKIGFKKQIRAQELSLSDWQKLISELKKYKFYE